MNDEKEILVLGTIEFGDKILVSDPMYTIGTWCTALVERVLPGKYIAKATIADCGDWGKRVSSLALYHEGFEDVFPEAIESRQIGVDAGLCGFWNPDEFAKIKASKAKNDRFFDALYDMENFGMLYHTAGVVSSSGFGDGGYNLYVGCDDDDRVVSLEVEFITEEELIEEDG